MSDDKSSIKLTRSLDNNPSLLFKLASDIRFWILILFVIRLYGITLPPLEIGHNWRQTDVTMPARNFLEIDNNILHPRLDLAGEKTGIAGMEFPLLNYLIYLTAEVFGYQHWYGRLINLIFSSIGLFYFFRLIRKYFKHEHAFYATIILAVSLFFPFSRKIMPDTFAMSLIIAGMYYGSNYLDGKSAKPLWLNLLPYIVLVALGALSKISGAHILTVFAIIFFDKNISFNKKIVFGLASVIAIIPTSIWHFYWSPHLVNTYGCDHFFMGVSFAEGFKEVLEHIPWTIRRFCDNALKFIGFAMFLFGLYQAIRQKNKVVIWLLALCSLSFLPIILKTGDNFSHHDYYVIPFVPMLAFVAGYGLTQIKIKRVALLILVAIALEGIISHSSDFRIREQEAFMSSLEHELDAVSKRDELIFINSGHSPTAMYFAHRKGWVGFNYQIESPYFVDSLSNKGLEYILILKRTLGEDISLPYNEVLNNENYTFYKIKK